MLTQHSVKKGLKIFGEAEVTAVIDGLKKFYSQEVLEPKIRNELTIDERKNVLRYLVFLKQNNSGQIQGRDMRHLRNTNHIPLTLDHDGTNIIKWWVDASDATHDNMKIHNGGVTTLGKGAIY